MEQGGLKLDVEQNASANCHDWRIFLLMLITVGLLDNWVHGK